MKSGHKRIDFTGLEKQRIIFLSCAAVALIIAIAFIVSSTTWRDKEVEIVSVEETLVNEDVASVDDADDAIPNIASFYAVSETPASANALAKSASEVSGSDIGIDEEAFNNLKADIDGIKAGDPEIIAKYFGTSDVFTPETVADRVSATIITLVSSEPTENGEYNLIVHVCTIDYPKMNSDYATAEANLGDDTGDGTKAKKEVTRNLIDGSYKVCYNIPLVVNSDGLVVSEAFKQAITGSWYTGTNVSLSPAECILSDSAS